MDTFYQVFGFVVAICAGIIFLALFFTLLSYFKRSVRVPGVVEVTGFIREGKLVIVHLKAGRTLTRVKFVGFTDQSSTQGVAVPYKLMSMVVFETEQGARIFVPGGLIRMIEEIVESA